MTDFRIGLVKEYYERAREKNMIKSCHRRKQWKHLRFNVTYKVGNTSMHMLDGTISANECVLPFAQFDAASPATYKSTSRMMQE